MQTDKAALVLGATGGIGSEVARQLRDAGWSVRGLARSQYAPATDDGITWIAGDAMRREDVMAAVQGCSVIVHAVNPQGYRRWAELVLPMIDNTIAAATTQGATILLPGTVYNFGPDAFPEPHEGSPQQPLTRKGGIRVELERRLRLATASGVRTIVVRAGDFFGPKPGNSWFSQAMVKPGRAVTVINLPGRKGIGHQWSYLPDVARTMVELLARRESLEPFAAVHMAGHWDEDGMQMAEAIRRVVVRRGGRVPTLRPFPWWLLSVVSPFVTTFREMREMRYLWQKPVRMTNDKLLSVLGEEPHTPLDRAIEATLHGMGCLDPSSVVVRTASAYWPSSH